MDDSDGTRGIKRNYVPPRCGRGPERTDYLMGAAAAFQQLERLASGSSIPIFPAHRLGIASWVSHDHESLGYG
jgi:hypothetical protein